MKDATIRLYDPATDADAVLALNQANVPEVGPLDPAKLAALAAEAEWMPVVEVAGKVVGFAILLVEGANYGSPNYAWFSGRHPRFYYVDRIAIGEGARGQGAGRTLYRTALERAAAANRPVLCAEVNTVPANEPSLRFHGALGFQEIERRSPYDPDSEVAMLECPTG